MTNWRGGTIVEAFADIMPIRRLSLSCVRRRETRMFDPSHLGDLNAVENFRRDYRSCADGVAAFVREAIGCAGKYRCPITRAQRMHRRRASCPQRGYSGSNEPRP